MSGVSSGGGSVIGPHTTGLRINSSALLHAAKKNDYERVKVRETFHQ